MKFKDLTEKIDGSLYVISEAKLAEIDFFDTDTDEFATEEIPNNHTKGLNVANAILLTKFKEVFATRYDSYLNKIMTIGKEDTIKAFIKKVVASTDCKFLKTFIASNAEEVLDLLITSINNFLSDEIENGELKKAKNKAKAQKSMLTRQKNKAANAEESDEELTGELKSNLKN